MNVRFDPMTGQPIYEEPTGFDPMTGQPVYEQPNPDTERAPKKGFAPKKWIPVIGAVVVLIILVLFLIPGIILGKNGRILEAAYNTVKKQGEFVQAVDLKSVINQDQYAVNTDLSIYGVSVIANVDVNKKTKQASTHGEVMYAGFGTDFSAYVDANEIQVRVPDLMERTFLYNYNEPATGMLPQLLAKGGMDLNEVNDAIRLVFHAEESTVDTKKMQKILKKEFQDLEFEKAVEGNFMVNGKDHKCKGYKLELNQDVYNNWIDAFQEIVEECNLEDSAAWGRITAETNTTAYFDELRQEVAGIEKSYVTVYIYRKQIAAIEFINSERECVRIELQGGDYPTQNWRVVDEQNDAVIFEQKSQINNSEEEMEWYAENILCGKLTYDSKSGDLLIRLGEADDSVSFDGNLKRQGKELSLTVDNIQVADMSVSVRGTVALTDHAKIEKLSEEGRVFDLGRANEAEWIELGVELVAKIKGLGLDSILDNFF